MEQQAGSVTTAVPTSFAPAVPSHAIKPFSNNHVPDTIDLRGDTKIIVCALAAPGNPVPGPFHAERERRTFWTACANCKKKNKHSIEYLLVATFLAFNAVKHSKPLKYQDLETNVQPLQRMFTLEQLFHLQGPWWNLAK